LIAFAALALSACAGSTRPNLYPNDTLMKGGQAAADAAINECMRLGDQYVQDPNKYGEVAKSGAYGAGVGAAGGALAGVITKGKVGRATAAGAAVGGLYGSAQEARNQSGHSEQYKRFVERCLSKKGYETIGWG